MHKKAILRVINRQPVNFLAELNGHKIEAKIRGRMHTFVRDRVRGGAWVYCGDECAKLKINGSWSFDGDSR